MKLVSACLLGDNCNLNGAQATLKIAVSVGATEALLTERSPSCGRGKFFMGHFLTGLLKVTVSRLRC
jgi:uncharacterized protein YbbK (DUF523 family)